METTAAVQVPVPAFMRAVRAAEWIEKLVAQPHSTARTAGLQMASSDLLRALRDSNLAD